MKKTFLLNSDFSELNRLDGFLKEIRTNFSINNSLFDAIKMALVEAVSNAIEHGNKFDKAKEVIVEFMSDNNQIEFNIIDEGSGFNPNNLGDPLSPDNLLKTRGRGVFLMKQFADEVHFNSTGNIIRLTFHLN